MRHSALFVAALLSGCGAASPSANAPNAAAVTLDALSEHEDVLGFHVVSLYLDDAGQPVGARFSHDKTGFTFDYLRIESAPQGYIWVDSFPTSDMGEPHTQEHLLLGKGDKGRYLGSYETMALADSSAFTGQWRTAYHFDTNAGHDAYWGVFANQLDALLHPDYTDEEIRREVRNFGVSKDADGKLHLEEKGTVYQEMVRTLEEPGEVSWFTMLRLMYGDTHPLQFNAGGTPDGLRQLTAADIRKFHDGAYHLGNMGMVGAFPSSMPLAAVLRGTAGVLDKLDDGERRHFPTPHDLPAPRSAAAGTVKIVEYPLSDASGPGSILFGYAPTRDLDATDRALLDLFASAFAGDESTPLYKLLVDSKTRKLDTGATSVSASSLSDPGMPVFISIDHVKPGVIEETTLLHVRELVTAELRRLAALPDHDPALLEFDAKVKSRLIDTRRQLSKFLSSPPGFGTRNIGSTWADWLLILERSPGWKKSITLHDELAAVDALLATGKNPWRDRLKAWGLLEPPLTVAAKASPALLARNEDERQQRLAAETARLRAFYKAPDDAEALRAYSADIDKTTAAMEAAAAAQPMPPLTDSPPQTLDDELHFRATELEPGVPLVASTFDSMASTTVGVAFRLDGVPDELLPYLAILPALLQDTGLHGGGLDLSSDAMKDRLRREVLSLHVGFQGNARTGRAELIITGAGNDVAETVKALDWMRLVMTSPDWRPENLPRLRDVVSVELAGLRTRMLDAEEHWVNDPADAYLHQDQPLLLHTRSFLTQAHDAARLRWLLEDNGDPATTAAVTAFLSELAGAGPLGRTQLVALSAALVSASAPGPSFAKYVDAAAKLPPAAQAIVRKAAKDLGEQLGDLPDSSLAADWAAMCNQIAHDLAVPRAQTLAALQRTREAIFARGNARVWVVGSSASQKATAEQLRHTLDALPAPATPAQHRAAHRLVDERVAARGGGDHPLFVGLVNPNTQSGVFVNSAKATFYDDAGNDEAILDYLAANLYAGHGAQGLFIKTWAAGLAYSNHLAPRLGEGRIEYYAERSPQLTATLGFVIQTLRGARQDPSLVAYAIAQAYRSRVADGFEDRAQAIADDLADGLTPDVVRRFRARLLALQRSPDLASRLYARLEAVCGRVLPGYGPKKSTVAGGSFFVIGPNAQLDPYERYLQTAEGADTKLVRIYPRDFWAE